MPVAPVAPGVAVGRGARDLSYALKPFPQLSPNFLPGGSAPLSMTPASSLATGVPQFVPGAQPLPQRVPMMLRPTPGVSNIPASAMQNLIPGPAQRQAMSNLFGHLSPLSQLPAPPTTPLGPAPAGAFTRAPMPGQVPAGMQARSMLGNVRGLGMKDLARGFKGAVPGAAAGAISGWGRSNILGGNVTGRMLTNESAPERFANTITGGMVAGAPGGAAGAIPFALGAGIGQAGIETAHALGQPGNPVADWAHGYGEETNPFMRIARQELSGALNTFAPLEGDELSPGTALGRIPGLISTGDKDAKEIMPGVLGTIKNAAGKAQTQAVDQVKTMTTSPDAMMQVASELGIDPRDASVLKDEWSQIIKSDTALAKRGLIKVPKTDDQGNLLDPSGKVTDDPTKAAQRPLTEAELPFYLKQKMDGMIAELPTAIAESRKARAEQTRADLEQTAAESRAQKKMMADAFGWSLAMNDLIAPQAASLSANPYSAPYAGLISQSFQQMPYQMLQAQQQSLQAQQMAEYQKQLNMAQNAPRTIDEEYQIALARALGAAEGKRQGGGAEEALLPE